MVSGAPTDGVNSNTFVERLKVQLQNLHQRSCPEIINPSCKKRASVALIVRIRPKFDDTPGQSEANSISAPKDFDGDLDSFFRQDWVQRGEPEVLFIKRAARNGDRWTGHIALPGGQRDPSDLGDQHTSVRETMEEVGLDLTADNVLLIGTLPQRTVATVFHSVPLMELCAFVYLITSPSLPPLRLQPSEIAAAHWVSFRAMLIPSHRTYESCDISDRLRVRGDWLIRYATRAVLGQMLYPAISLIPYESLYSSPATSLPSQEDFPAGTFSTIKSKVTRLLFPSHFTSGITRKPLLLWGLTHGIVTDFLGLLPPYRTLELWTWPTFTYWDVRFILWLTTFRFRYRKLHSVAAGSAIPMIAAEGLVAPSISRNEETASEKREDYRPGMQATPQFSCIGHLLDGYFQLTKRAVVIILATRLAFGLALAGLTFNRSRNK
ncbi:MAG: hypothetical protein MMC33_000686 [Icmadophila ericetorum]|nr:hypothetical protein [Icmadophila ericetorum]